MFAYKCKNRSFPIFTAHTVRTRGATVLIAPSQVEDRFSWTERNRPRLGISFVSRTCLMNATRQTKIRTNIHTGRATDTSQASAGAQSPWYQGWGGVLLSFALGVSGLKDTGGRHEVLNVLTQNLVLWLQFEVLLFDSIHPGRQVL